MARSAHLEEVVIWHNLHLAVTNGRIGELKKLIEERPVAEREDLLTKPSHGYSLLGAACYAGQHGAIEMMLRYMSLPRALNVAASSNGVTTPLIIAVERASLCLLSLVSKWLHLTPEMRLNGVTSMTRTGRKWATARS